MSYHALRIIFIPEISYIIVKISTSFAIWLPNDMSLQLAAGGGNRRQKEVKRKKKRYSFIWTFEKQITLQSCLLPPFHRERAVYCDSHGRPMRLGIKNNRTSNLKFPLMQETLNPGQTILSYIDFHRVRESLDVLK